MWRPWAVRRFLHSSHYKNETPPKYCMDIIDQGQWMNMQNDSFAHFRMFPHCKLIFSSSSSFIWNRRHLKHKTHFYRFYLSWLLHFYYFFFSFDHRIYSKCSFFAEHIINYILQRDNNSNQTGQITIEWKEINETSVKSASIRTNH